MVDIIVRLIPETYNDAADSIHKLVTCTYSAHSMHIIAPGKMIGGLKKTLVEEYKLKIDFIGFYPSSGSMARDINTVIKQTSFDYILITTGGVKVERDWVDMFIRECSGSVMAGVSPKLTQPSGLVYYAGVVDVMSAVPGMRGYNVPDRTGELMAKEDCISLIDDFMFFKRSVYARVGEFDPQFKKFFYEHDWCKRVRAETGLQLCYFFSPYFVFSGKLMGYGLDEWYEDRERYCNKHGIPLPQRMPIAESPVVVPEADPVEEAPEEEAPVDICDDANETVEKETVDTHVKRKRKSS